MLAMFGTLSWLHASKIGELFVEAWAGSFDSYSLVVVHAYIPNFDLQASVQSNHVLASINPKD